ncbi:nuclear transport factor 2 family protein [Streptomyces sp. NBC_01373]|uniref:nuclear transport factor 2 family protein n=1 Tax=Streptomyces sp. NBC_01373 TaxID=2903843 RepID=UPI00224D5B1A|nr:nuclear transport factor 2 family protein [Streptomyces sp. NBC_01373]MCX4704538.1 nuclear transport factor 2 family protein [Streptomyces sp. NBC_01373]
MTTTSPDVEASVAAGVQAAIAAYAQALDTNRVDDLAELFTPDGVSEIAGMATFEGRDAIRQGYAGFASTQPQLHLVANTVVTSCTEDEATAVSNLAFFQRGDSGWAVQLVGRYDDTLRRQDGVWRFHKRVTTFLP